MIIRGGTVISGEGLSQADVHVHGEKISAVIPRAQMPGEPAESPSAIPPDEPVIDAKGLWVLPGGIDAHTHFGMPLGPEIRSLGWRSSSTSALLGGTTTVVDFANPEPGQSLQAAVQRWQEAATGRCLCDFGLHCTVTQTSDQVLSEIPGLVAGGIPTLKGFLAYKNRLMLAADQMRKLMGVVKESGGLLLVHAEDGEMNATAEQILADTGRTAARWHPMAHPPESEEKAVAEVLEMALQTGCPLLVVHMSLGASLNLLEGARKRRDTATDTTPLLGEVCLHHLFADESIYDSGHEPALAGICSPPLRQAGNGLALLGGLVKGQIEIFSTDHCEFPLRVKSRAASGGFARVPNGCGGVGERLVLSHTLAVATGRLEPTTWVAALSERPAQVMGLAGRKGRIAPEHDADLVLFDPAASYRWEPAPGSDRAGNIWAGMPVCGAVRDVWLRGSHVVRSGRLQENQPAGEFLPRTLSL